VEKEKKKGVGGWEGVGDWKTVFRHTFFHQAGGKENNMEEAEVGKK
jgi:hypothetical protein